MEQQQKFWVKQNGELLGIFVDFIGSPKPEGAFKEVFTLPEDGRQIYDFENDVWLPLNEQE